ncbi:ubiquitin, putative [Babesia ovis]|uniref:Ubiquitin, putative n=1 Tax=Babesia ovis TaxID=5869 RepID=A0A9W5T9E7_BABOV|nr:ubiquitin, putative [Babesia ovis]
MVNITINNHFGDKEPATLSLTNISDDITVSSICILVENQFKCMKPGYHDEREPEEKFVLYCGHQELQNSSQLSEYNSVGLHELTFYLYERRSINVTVHLIKYIQCCGIYFSPVWGKLFAKKLTFKILDHHNLLKLKIILLGYLDGYTTRQGEKLTPETVRLVHKRYLLEDDLQQIKDINGGNDLSLTLLMPLKYAVRPDTSLSGRKLDSARCDKGDSCATTNAQGMCHLTIAEQKMEESLQSVQSAQNEVTAVMYAQGGDSSNTTTA